MNASLFLLSLPFTHFLRKIWIVILCSFSTMVFSQKYYQYGFEQKFNISCKDSVGNNIPKAWNGGLNSCTFGQVDLNHDGIKDLVIFDKNTGRLHTYLNKGGFGQIQYEYHPEYALSFPKIESWMQLIDYNKDGKEDIFTYYSGGIRVYENISDDSLKFRLAVNQIKSLYGQTATNLFCLSDDYPGIVDIDGDGDLDIINFWLLGTFVHYHKNVSMEKYGVPDSLEFKLEDESWGCFAESEDGYHIMLDTCYSSQKIALDLKSSEAKHAGSTIFAVDINNDSLIDVGLGDLNYPAITFLSNHGTKEKAKMTTLDTLFPNPAHPVNLQSFPVISYVDINNDGEKDLLVSPFDSHFLASENKNSIWHYENQGNNQFTFRSSDFLQNEMIDLGSGAFPVLFDYDNDGLLDLFVGNLGRYDSSYVLSQEIYQSVFSSQIALYKNIGTTSEPAFRCVTHDLLHSKLNGLYPALGDIDNDGKIEMIVGNETGNLFLYRAENIINDKPEFVLIDSNYQQINVGNYSAPQLFDLDKDGKLDLIIGEKGTIWRDGNRIVAKKGNLNYYKNTGTLNSPVFTKITDSLGGVDVTNWEVSNYGYSTPCFFRTAQGETRLFAGCEDGSVFCYNNIDDNLDGTFRLVEKVVSHIQNQPYPINLGSHSAIAVADLNHDGLPDMICGNLGGGLEYFEGKLPLAVNIQKVDKSTHFEVSVYPNPASDRITIVSDAEIQQVVVFDVFGRTITQKAGSQKSLEIDIKNKPSGFYFLQIDLSKNGQTERILRKICVE